jgi:hypothetical protein
LLDFKGFVWYYLLASLHICKLKVGDYYGLSLNHSRKKII